MSSGDHEAGSTESLRVSGTVSVKALELLPNTGRLVVVGRHGELTPVVDGRGQELLLDRPTSLEFVGNTAYVVSVTGDVYRVQGLLTARRSLLQADDDSYLVAAQLNAI